MTEPRQAAAQARQGLYEFLDKKCGFYGTVDLRDAINIAYKNNEITEEDKNNMHKARKNMNKIIHALPGDNGSDFKPEKKHILWRAYLV